jgi:hypothetical protein
MGNYPRKKKLKNWELVEIKCRGGRAKKLPRTKGGLNDAQRYLLSYKEWKTTGIIGNRKFSLKMCKGAE